MFTPHRQPYQWRHPRPYPSPLNTFGQSPGRSSRPLFSSPGTRNGPSIATSAVPPLRFPSGRDRPPPSPYSPRRFEPRPTFDRPIFTDPPRPTNAQFQEQPAPAFPDFHAPPLTPEVPRTAPRDPPTFPRNRSNISRDPPPLPINLSNFPRDPPTFTGDPPTFTRDPPTFARDPPIFTRDPPIFTRDPPTFVRDPLFVPRVPPSGRRAPPSGLGPTRARAQAKEDRRLRRYRPRTPPPIIEDDKFSTWVDVTFAWDDVLDLKEPLTKEDEALLRQLSKLKVDKVMRESLAREEERVERAAAAAPERMKEIAERDAKLKATIAEEQREEERKRLEEERQFQAAKWEEERIREEARLAEERRQEEARLAEERRQEEAWQAEQARCLAEINRLQKLRIEESLRLAEEARREKLRREEEARKAAEETRRQFEEREKARREREQRDREEAARCARQREEEIRRLQEEARRAQEAADEAAAETKLRDDLDLYDRKWEELKRNRDLSSLIFTELPWPLLFPIASPAQITYEGVQEFVFHPLRKGLDGKTRRERVKAEVLRFHPDKFTTIVLGKVRDWERDLAAEASGVVARILTRMMTEEVDRARQV